MYNTITISLDGQEMPVCFNMLAISELAKRAGISIGEVFQRFEKIAEFDVNKMLGDDLEFVYELIFIGLLIGGEVENKPLTLNLHQIACLVGFDGGIMEKVFTCFANSMPQEPAEKPDAKKKKLAKAS